MAGRHPVPLARRNSIKAAEWPGPVYIRLGRSKSPVVTSEDDEYEIGKGVLLNKGKDVTIVACGQMVYEAVKAAEVVVNS